jgi:hypothetical protein
MGVAVDRCEGEGTVRERAGTLCAFAAISMKRPNNPIATRDTSLDGIGTLLSFVDPNWSYPITSLVAQESH